MTPASISVGQAQCLTGTRYSDVRTVLPPAPALGSVVERFAEMALAQGQLNCKLDDAANTLATLFVSALQMKHPEVARSRA